MIRSLFLTREVVADLEGDVFRIQLNMTLAPCSTSHGAVISGQTFPRSHKGVPPKDTTVAISLENHHFRSLTKLQLGFVRLGSMRPLLVNRTIEVFNYLLTIGISTTE